jgi:hypothetical protein
VIDLREQVSYQLTSQGNELRVELGQIPQMMVDSEKVVLAESSPAPAVPPEGVDAAPNLEPDVGMENDSQRTIPIESTISGSVKQPLQAPGSFKRYLSMEVGFSSIYEDNIDHDEVNPIESVGVVPSLRTQISAGQFYTSYELGFHQYTNTEEWDRVSHVIRSGYVIPFGERFFLDTRGEISLGGSSEDREKGDQFAFKPIFAFLPGDSTQIELEGAYRARKFDTGSDAINRYVGIEIEQEFGKHEVLGEYRYEVNDSENSRNDRNIYTYKMAYRIPFPWKTEAIFGARLRETDYLNRFVELEVEDGPDIPLYLREDKKWAFGAAMKIPLGKNVDLVPEYEYEVRTSNDPEKQYVANVASVSIIYELW